MSTNDKLIVEERKLEVEPKIAELKHRKCDIEQKLNAIKAEIRKIESSIAAQDQHEHLKKEGYATVQSHDVIQSIGHVIRIQSTTVPIRPGDIFRFGTGYGNTFQVKFVRTSEFDILESEIPVENVGMGILEVIPLSTISALSKRMIEGDRIIKVTLS